MQQLLELSHHTPETAAASLSASLGRGLCPRGLTSAPGGGLPLLVLLGHVLPSLMSPVVQDLPAGTQRGGVSFLRDSSVLCQLVPGPSRGWTLAPAASCLQLLDVHLVHLLWAAPSCPPGTGQGCGSHADAGLCGACPLSAKVYLWENLRAGCPQPHARTPGPTARPANRRRHSSFCSWLSVV